MIKTKQGNSDQRLNYAQRDSLHNAKQDSSTWREMGEEKEIKICELSVTVEVCSRCVILLCIGGKVMDTSVAAEGRSSEESSPECSTFYLY